MLLVSGATKTMRRLASGNSAALGHLVTPRCRRRLSAVVDTGLPWAIDNGAFSGFDAVAFERLCLQAAGLPRLLWVACPDVVGNARMTLERFADWAPRLHAHGLPVAFVGQDGIENEDIPWDEFSAWFVGGTTDWKLSDTACDLCHAAKRRGKWVHVGRVNSLQRIKRARAMGADSIDGSSASMFPDTYIEKYLCWIDRADRQALLGFSR